MKPVAKSLHTVTVIAELANVLLRSGAASDVDGAVAAALDVLALAGKPDVYGLAEKAAKLVRI